MTILSVYTSQEWNMADSYGLIACQLARHLTRLGVHVNAVSLKQTVSDSQPEDIRAITSRPILPSLGGIVLGYPTNYAYHSSLLHVGPRIAITMFESTKLPQGWKEPLNDLDAVIVPTHFCADVFRDNGVAVPVHVVPPGIGEVFTYRKREQSKPLTFLSFLDRGARKGGLTALQSFLTAFGDDPNYRLILKGRTPKPGRAFSLTNPNIEVIQQDMSEEELYELYCNCHVLVNPHKGEGFGLIPREFAATGGLAMTTNWSGTADDIDQWGYPLPYELVRAGWEGHSSLEGQELGEWANVDYKRAATHLLNVAHAWQWSAQGLEEKAEAARRLYSWHGFAERVLAIWREAANGYGTRLSAA
jgi:glycosyltransferase involved in cell wall biosynthesis